MLSEVSKQNLKSMGGRIREFGLKIEELDPGSSEFIPRLTDLLNRTDEMVKIARDVIKGKRE